MSNPNTHPEYSRARSLIDQALNEISEDGDIGEFANCLLGQSCALYRLGTFLEPVEASRDFHLRIRASHQESSRVNMVGLRLDFDP